MLLGYLLVYFVRISCYAIKPECISVIGEGDSFLEVNEYCDPQDTEKGHEDRIV